MKKIIYTATTIGILLTALIGVNVYQFNTAKPIEGSISTKRESFMSTSPIDVTRYYKIKHNLGYKPIVNLTFQDQGSPSKIQMPYEYTVVNQDDGVKTEESLTFEPTEDMVIIKQRLKYDGGSGRSIESGIRKFEYRLSRPIFKY
jgi:hypothetical protein